MEYCFKSIYSPDGWSRPRGLPLDANLCVIPSHNEDDDTEYDCEVENND